MFAAVAVLPRGALAQCSVTASGPPGTICLGDVIQLDATVTSGTGPFTFDWTINNGSASWVGSNTVEDPFIQVFTSPVNVTVNAEDGFGNACPPITFSVSASSTSAMLSATVNGLSAGLYLGYGNDFPTFTLCEDPPPVLSTFIFNDSSATNTTPLAINYGTGWIVPPVFPLPLSYSPGLDTIVYVVEDVNTGCVDTTLIGVLVGPPLAIPFSQGILEGTAYLCAPDSVHLQLSSFGGFTPGVGYSVSYNYTGFVLDTILFPAALPFTYAVEFPFSSCGYDFGVISNTFAIQVQSNYGCIVGAPATNYSTSLFYSDPPEAFLTASDTVACAGGAPLNFVNQSTGQWVDAGNGCNSPLIYWDVSPGTNGVQWSAVPVTMGNGGTNPAIPSTWTPGSSPLPVSFNWTGLYTIEIFAGGSDSCAVDSFQLEICADTIRDPAFAISASGLCVPGPVIATITNTTDLTNSCGEDWWWTAVADSLYCGGSGTVTWLTSQGAFEPQLEVSDPGMYLLTAHLTNACGTFTQTDTLIVQGAPYGAMPPLATVPCVGDTLPLASTVSGCGSAIGPPQYAVLSGPATITTANEIVFTGTGQVIYQLLDSNACTNGALVVLDVDTVVAQAPAATPVVSISSPVCDGGMVILSTPVQVGVTSYFWITSSGDTLSTQATDTIVVDLSMSGNLTVIAGGGACVGDTVVPFIVQPITSIAIVPDPLTLCAGIADTLMVIGGSGIYGWAEVGVGPLPDGAYLAVAPLASTAYIAYDTIAGCPTSDTVSVTVNPLPALNIGPDLTLCDSGSVYTVGIGLPGTFSTPAPVGLVPSLNPPTITPIPGVGANFYLAYEETNAFGCTGFDTIWVDIVTGQTPPDAGPPLTQCINYGLLFPSGSPITGSWLDIAPFFTSGEFDPVGAGLGTVTIYYCSSGCPNWCDSTLVTVLDTPTFSVPADTTVCAGSGVLALGGAGSWYGTGLNTYVTSTGNFDASAAPPGTYQNCNVQSNGLCTDTLCMNVTVAIPPTASFSYAPVPPCAQSAITFTSTGAGGSQWVWDFGDLSSDSGSVVAHSYAVPGSYTVTLTVSDGNGCSSTAQQVVTVLNNLPFLDFSFTNPVGCNGLIVDFTNVSSDQGDVDFTWNYGNGQTSAGDTAFTGLVYPGSATQDTTYTVTMTATWPCGTVSVQHTITVIAQPEVTVLIDNDNGCDTLATVQILATGQADSFFVDFGDGTDTTWLSTGDTLFFIHDYPLGTVDVYYQLTVSTINPPCPPTVVQAVVPVLVDSLISAISAVPDEGCEDLAVSFIGSVAGAQSELWDFGDGTPPVTTPDPGHTFTEPGSYWVVHTAFGCYGTLSDSVLIEVWPAANVDSVFVSTIACTGTPVQVVALDTTMANYSWYVPGQGWISGSAGIEYLPDGPGPDTLYLAATTTGVNDCPDTATIVINVLQTVTADIEYDTLVGCEPLDLHVWIDPIAGASVVWSLDTLSTAPGFDFSYSPLYADSLWLLMNMTDANGCPSQDSDLVVVHPSPTAAFTSSVRGTIEQAIVDFHNASTGQTSNSWWFSADGTTSDELEPSRPFPRDSCELSARLIVENPFGCMDTTFGEVDLEPLEDLYVPNTFTPDGDGMNDVFVVTSSSLGASYFELLIFNRWGEQVFKSTSITAGWDGMYGGVMSQDAVYVYKVKYQPTCTGDRRERIGHVTLVK